MNDAKRRRATAIVCRATGARKFPINRRHLLYRPRDLARKGLIPREYAHVRDSPLLARPRGLSTELINTGESFGRRN